MDCAGTCREGRCLRTLVISANKAYLNWKLQTEGRGRAKENETENSREKGKKRGKIQARKGKEKKKVNGKDNTK